MNTIAKTHEQPRATLATTATTDDKPRIKTSSKQTVTQPLPCSVLVW
ncbi:MAG: hypothetical protein ABJE95_37880 [Byssovorax sp.]